MKKSILLAAIITGGTFSSFADVLTVYGDRSTTNESTTTSSNGTVQTSTTITCDGDMNEVCYTRTTGSDQGSGSNAQLGTGISISIYENGVVKKVRSGILRAVNESPQTRTASYTIERK